VAETILECFFEEKADVGVVLDDHYLERG